MIFLRGLWFSPTVCACWDMPAQTETLPSVQGQNPSNRERRLSQSSVRNSMSGTGVIDA